MWNAFRITDYKFAVLYNDIYDYKSKIEMIMVQTIYINQQIRKQAIMSYLHTFI